MSQWNRTTLPTEADADEWGNILVLRSKGRKSIEHWQAYIEDGMQKNGNAWMALPPSDEPQGCCKNCKCKRETPRQSNGSIYGAHWAW